MVEYIDYLIKNGGATIVRAYGQGSIVDLPDTIEGLPVLGLADHCFAPEMSVRIPKGQVRRWNLLEGRIDASYQGASHKDTPREGTSPASLSGEALEEIYLPGSLLEVGDYAFYNCYGLKRIHFPGSLERLGRGCFTAVNRLEEICFFLEGSDVTIPGMMKDVLGELNNEVDAVLENAAGETVLRLIFPEYYEESIENTPARLINMHFEGTGFRYRQCFQGKDLDLARYDAIFPTAINEEYPPTVMRLAFCRLETPARLSEDAKASYLSYLKAQSQSAADYVLGDTHRYLLRLLIREGYFKGEGAKERLTLWMDMAAKRKAAEEVTLLMEQMRGQNAGPKKKYAW